MQILGQNSKGQQLESPSVFGNVFMCRIKGCAKTEMMNR